MNELGRTGTNVFDIVKRLKYLKRTGWVNRGISNAESVADHSFMTSLLSYVLAAHAGLNPERAAVLGLIHDLAEALVGDITPFDGVSKADKRTLEANGMTEIAKAASLPSLTALWEEYEYRLSPEAELVHSVDKLETILQAEDYERLHGTDLFVFADHATRTEDERTQQLLHDPVTRWRSKRSAR